MITLDFETKKIEDFKPLLPEPVGCAIRFENGISHYYSWAHPTENNCTKEEFKDVLLQYWDGEILTQNGSTFDIPIAEHWFNLPRRDPLLTHDTLFLAYLLDPHSPQLGLKWLAENWLGMPPDDQQELYDWIMRNTECKSRKKAGAYISEAPGGLAGKYACSDVEMTYALFQYAFPKVYPQMAEAYHRELQLAPILADLQNRGVRCDVERLERDTTVALNTLHSLDAEIRAALKVESLSLDSDAELVGALKNRGFTNFLSTPTGKVSAAKDSLDLALADAPELRELLKKRATFATLTSTFMLPYLEACKVTGGRLHPSFNQVRNPDGYGTRTGRLSSSKPNFQNLPGDLGKGYPLIRSYMLPEEGHVWVSGDFSAQEPRITSHFEDGRLLAEYKSNVNLDPYLFVAELCGVTRKQAKTVFLGIVYAMGAQTMADGLGCSAEEAGRLRTIIRATLPDITQLDYDCKRRAQLGLPVRTLGGRLYHTEPPKNGRRFEYKMLNTLIQGSAADQTKQAMIYIHGKLLPGERILVTVHDSIAVSCKVERADAIGQIMQEAANSLPCDCPMKMDVGYGGNWHESGH